MSNKKALKSNKLKKKSSKSRKERFNKIIVLSMVGLMGLSTIGGLVTAVTSSLKATQMDYTTNIELALKNNKEIDDSKIEELVAKQAKGDYTLKTMIDTLGENPAYIAEGYNVTYESDKLTKLIDKYMTKKSYKNADDLIELLWETKNNKSITTYIATDVTDKVNVVGLFINDEGLDMTAIDKNDKISKTELKFEEFADTEMTLKELEEKVGTTYPYSIRYPLFEDSEIVKINSREEDIPATVSQRIFRTANSTVIVYVSDDNIISFDEMLDKNDDIAKFDTNKVKKAKENMSLKEDSFLETFEGAKLISIGEARTKEDKSFKGYIIKDKENNVYNIGFEDGVLSYFDGGEDESTTNK